MYPHVVQFQTRRHQIDGEIQLIGERTLAQASAGDARPRRAAQAPAGERARRDQGTSALLRIVAFLTGAPSHDHPPVPEDALPVYSARVMPASPVTERRNAARAACSHD